MKLAIPAILFAGAWIALLAGVGPTPAQSQTPTAETPRASDTTVVDGKTVKLTTLKDGLQYYDIKVGTGDGPKIGQTISVLYTGTLLNGIKFDSSADHGGQPIDFPIGVGMVIKGWDEGVPTMKVGGKRRLVIPANLAYGAHPPTKVIPPNATLVFDVELVAVKPLPPDTTTIDGKKVKLTTMPDGLQYYDIKVGTGVSPKIGQTVSVQYTGTLLDGTKFDSSYDHGGQPIDFPIGVGQVIPGWDEGVPPMKVGGKRRLVIPGNLAYGPNSPTPAIPPNATLVFDIELVAVK